MGFSISIDIETKGFEEQAAKFRQYPQIVAKRFKKAMIQSTLLVRGATVREWPVGVTGRSRSAWSTRTTAIGADVTGRITNPVRTPYPYPAVIEHGRKPGKAPPPGALDRWVQIVMGVPANLVSGVAYLVGRKIARRGIKGKRILRKAYDTNKPKILRFFRDALNLIAKDLSIGD